MSWNNFTSAITQSLLTRLLANIFLFLVLLSGLIIACVNVLQGQDINTYARAIVWAGVGYCLHLLGLNQGVTLEAINPGTKKD